MKSGDAILQAWEETLARKGDSAAIFDTKGAVTRTFSQIEAQSRELACKLKQFEPGSVIAVQVGNDPAWPEILIACFRRKLVVLPLETTISKQERESALKACKVSGVVAAPKAFGAEALEILSPEMLPVRLGPAATIRWEKQPSLLKLTSGTTAAPRAIHFRSEQLLADCNQICATMGISDTDLNFGVIPVSHSYGFSNLLTPLIARGIPMVLSRDRLPRAVLIDLAKTNATVFPGMPVFYQAFCEMENIPALPTLRLCVSAGAPLRGALAKRLHEKFGLPIHSFYGSSECGGICYDADGTSFEDGFVGTPMQDVDLEMVEPGADSSQVRVRSAAVADGYWPDPNESKLGNGVFVPDDVLARGDDGFRIIGRISDVINVAGKKVNPAQVEEQLLKVSGVREAIAFGRKSSQRNEEVAACVVTDSTVNESELLEFCRKHLSGWQVPKRIFLLDQIPVNERGKVSRKELAVRFAN